MKNKLQYSNFFCSQFIKTQKNKISIPILLFLTATLLIANLPFAECTINTEDWQIISGNWVLTNENLTGTSSPNPSSRAVILSNGEPVGPDYDLSAKVHIIEALEPADPKPEGQIIVKYEDPENYYFVGLGVYGYKAAIGTIVDNDAELIAYGGNPDYTDLQFGVDYDLKVEIRGNTINVYVDGQFVCSATDTSHSSGVAGLSTIWSKTLFHSLGGEFEKESENIEREIFVKTQFLEANNLTFQIRLEGFSISRIKIIDQDSNTIYNLTGNLGINPTTAEITIEQGKPYFLTVEDTEGNNSTNVFYRSENILENMPSNFWWGNEYQQNYNEYIDVFEQAYNVILNLTRNGQDIKTGGVTINRVNRPIATGGWGYITYGIHQWFEYPLITEKVYLPNHSTTYTHPDLGITTMNAKSALSTRFHELAHAVLLETSGNDPFPQEGIACFFQIELFRLLGYTQDYIEDAATISISNFQNYIGENLSGTATEFMKAYDHIFPGAWIAAYVLEDLVGYGELENQIIITPTSYFPDLGWDFLKKYFEYSTNFEAPADYNINERLLYFFELASNRSLKQDFINLGFNITNTYDQSPPLFPSVEYTLNISVDGSGNTNPSTGTHTYQENSNIEITATASSGWSFDHWLLDSVNVGSTNPYSITINTNHSLTAIFSENPSPEYETIYIRADGSIEGIDTIQQTENIYTFTETIFNQSIVVEKDDIVIDGEGYTLQGTGVDTGIGLNGRTNVTIKNLEITNFRYGIMLMSSSNNILTDNNAYSNTWAGIQLGSSNNNTISGNSIANNTEDGIALYSSSFNTISRNNITTHNRDSVAFYYYSNNNTLSTNNITNSSGHGIRLDISSFNTVSKNNITNNAYGIFLWSSNHKIYHNNFINNINHAGSFEPNTWDDGYPSGGNYWSNYNGTDNNGDQIGDTPYIIDENNQDNYPFINPIDIENIPELPSWVYYDLSISVSGSGTTNPSTGTHTYTEGTGVYVTTSPTTGWTFSYWLLDSVNVGSSNPYTITMNADHSLTAVFTETPPPEYDLSVSVSGSGSTSPPVGTHTYEQGTEVVVTASPGSGWIFSHWLLESANVGNLNPFTVTMDVDHNLAAIFTENIPEEPFELTTHDIILENRTFIIETNSNSTISELNFNLTSGKIQFTVNGTSGTTGLCNITIPSELMSGDFLIYKDNTQLIKNVDYTETFNGTYYLFTITYEHSIHTIEIIATTIIPEFRTWSSLALFLSASLLAIIIKKAKRVSFGK